MDETILSRTLPPLVMRATVMPSTIDVEARTAEIVWTTGARVLRGFYERYYEELSLDPTHVRMERLESSTTPLLDAHAGWSNDAVIGVVESARLEPGRGIARVRFARAEDDERAEKIFRKIVDGVLRNVSVGYRTYRLEKVEDGENQIPVMRATDWEPYEISIVPMGADAGAHVRAGVTEHQCVFVGIGGTEERSMDPEKENESKSENPSTPDPDAIRQEAVAAERKRAAGIRRAGEILGLGSDFIERHIAEGASIEQFRELAIDERGKQAPIVGDGGRALIVPGEDARDKWLRGAGDWLVVRAAVTGTVEAAAKARGESYRCDPGEFRGLSMVELARQCLERSGVNTRGMDRVELVGAALTQRGGGYHTTGDFPVLLENVMHKVLLGTYDTTPDTWSRFCAVGSVSDFRPYPRYRMGSFGQLSRLNEHGEFQNQQIPDARKETIAADTLGNIIALSRKAIINDDMSAFTRLATMYGRAARLSIENAVYALLAENAGLGPRMNDGKTLFHADHKNIGADSELSVAGIEADRVVMAKQRDESGNEFLDLRPAILAVSIGQGGQARVINDAEYDVDSVAAGAANKFMQPNKVRGLFRDIVDTPRLGGTRRYLFADPGTAPTIEVVFLDGRQSPYLESRDGWRVDGVELKVRLDAGVGAIDYRGAVTNAGVAAAVAAAAARIAQADSDKKRKSK